MTDHVATLDHERFDVSAENGFLPATEPLASFGTNASPYLRTLDELKRDLPELLEEGGLRAELRAFEDPPTRELFDTLSERELVRVYSITGFLANAYIHGVDAPAANSIPSGVAVPLYESTTRLGCTPVLSYDAYVLHNWTCDVPNRSMTPDTVTPVTSFTTLRDERWFIAIHVAIEGTAGPAITAIGDAQQSILEDDADRVARALRMITESVDDVLGILLQMPDHNDPEVYGQGFRPYLGSFTNVQYEGVRELDGPQSFRGASGAQSSLFPALDAVLGIDHGDNPLVAHLRTLRKDMPPSHRAFLETIENGPNLYEYVRNSDSSLKETYNECIDQMAIFRERHIEVVEQYLTGIVDGREGTGGTPYGRYLGTFTDDTRECKLPV